MDIRHAKRLTVPTSRIIPWDKNPRIVKKSNHERLKRQIIELGLYRPLLCAQKSDHSKYITIGGNQRLSILRELGQKEIEISLISSRKESDWIKYALSDNDFVGETDEQALAELVYPHIKEINLRTYHVAVIEPVPLENVLEEFGPELDESREDSVPPLDPADVGIKCGDLFELGPHRLMCGDGTDRADMERLMAGRMADCVFTDPPYNVDYSGGTGKHGKILGDNQTEEEFIEFSLRFMERIREALKPGGVFYICSGYDSYPTFVYSIKKQGMVFSCPIIWVKNNTSLGWGDYRHKHEMMLQGRSRRQRKKAQPLLYGWNGGKHYFCESRFEADVWEAKRRAGQSMLHPTQSRE